MPQNPMINLVRDPKTPNHNLLSTVSPPVGRSPRLLHLCLRPHSSRSLSVAVPRQSKHAGHALWLPERGVKPKSRQPVDGERLHGAHGRVRRTWAVLVGGERSQFSTG
jgi:hypothetical protein